MVNILRYSVALKYLLKERKMSEDYLAKKLKKDPSTINRWTNSWKIVSQEPVPDPLLMDAEKQANILLSVPEKQFKYIIEQRRKYFNEEKK